MERKITNTAGVLAFSVLFPCFFTTTLGLEYGSETLVFLFNTFKISSLFHTTPHLSF